MGKAMKAEVAALKRSRKKLPKKGGKDEKKAVSQKIRKLIASLRARHEAELKAAGSRCRRPRRRMRMPTRCLMSDRASPCTPISPGAERAYQDERRASISDGSWPCCL